MKEKDFKPTQEMIDAATKVLVIQALIGTIEPVIREIETKLLKEMRIPMANKNIECERAHGLLDSQNYPFIMDSRNMYLASDEDAKRYFDAYDKAKDEAGFEKYGRGYCPLLVEEYNLIKANRHFVDTMEPISGISFENVLCSGDFLKYYKELINLNLSLMAPFLHV